MPNDPALDKVALGCERPSVSDGSQITVWHLAVICNLKFKLVMMMRPTSAGIDPPPYPPPPSAPEMASSYTHHPSKPVSGPGPTSRTYAVDLTQSERRAWLVKVPELIAEIARSSTAPTDIIGTFDVEAGAGAGAGTGAGAAGLRKRSRFSFEVSKARAAEVLGAERAASIPTRYAFTLEPPSVGARILVQSGTTFNFQGVAAASGAIIPDSRDANYARHATARRDSANRAAVARPRSLLESDDGLIEIINQKRAAAAAVVVASAAAAAAADVVGAGAGGASAGAGVGASITSVLQAFEHAPHWKLTDLARVCGGKQDAVKEELQRVADYVRAGKFARNWICKVEYRTPGMPAPDSEATSNRVTGGE